MRTDNNNQVSLRMEHFRCAVFRDYIYDGPSYLRLVEVFAYLGGASATGWVKGEGLGI
ncbi:hypothetical protein ACF046_01155 [Glutamicibacter creatinolyticus]|uniref:hypothetical protein n=1 Tax=Glutamicibacter creatinolyticus TaxID=162496 RepID=UPI0033D7BFFB